MYAALEICVCGSRDLYTLPCRWPALCTQGAELVFCTYPRVRLSIPAANSIRIDAPIPVHMHLLTHMRVVTRRKLQTPGNAEEHNRQETPTINPTGQYPTGPTDKPHRPNTKHYVDKVSEWMYNTGHRHAVTPEESGTRMTTPWHPETLRLHVRGDMNRSV